MNTTAQTATVVALPRRDASTQKGNPAREKLLAHGAGALADSELLDLLLPDRRSASDAAAQAARALATAGGLKPLLQKHPDDLAKLLGKAGAASALAAAELGRRFLRATDTRPKLCDADAVYRYLLPSMAGLTREVFRVMSFSTRNTLLDDTRIAEGTQDACLVDPRDVFGTALRHKATAICVAHNHPAGSPLPSTADIALTRQLHAAGVVLNIRLLDHLVLGDGTYTSMRDRGDLP